MKTNDMRRQIDSLDFAKLEMNLYLDVHPMDEAARRQYNQYAEQLEQMERQYTQQTGKVWPMRQNEYGGTLAWVDEPWPWEYQY